MSFRDRVVELRRVRAGDLVSHDKNWRTHPEDQRSALSAMLDEVGFAGAIVARVDDAGRVVVIDGHLRADMDPDATVPVLITDLDTDEADKLLATYDPIGDMAIADPIMLRELLDSIETSSEDVADLLKRVEFDARIDPEPKQKAPKPPPRPDPLMGDSLEPVLRGEKQWIVLEGDVRERLRDLPDGCVQTVVTSPPYWGLRDYGTAEWEGGDPDCDHKRVDVDAWVEGRKNRPNPSGSGIGKAGATFEAQTAGMAAFRGGTCGKCGAKRLDSQIGLEETFDEWVAQMVAVMAEVRRVLRDDGTVWLNLGDAYANSPPRLSFGDQGDNSIREETRREMKPKIEGLKQKDLIGQPWEVAFALRADGWYLRSEIIWHKPNPMPESVTDRPTKAHETVFLLSKRPRYFYDADAVRGEYARAWWNEKMTSPGNPDRQDGGSVSSREESTGSNLRDVWTIATDAFAEAHFATFPRKLVEPCIRAGASEAGACPTCGAPWTRETDVSYEHAGGRGNEKTLTEGASAGGQAPGPQGMKHGRANKVVTTTGWQPTCDCEPAEPIGCLVLDPFNGSGTTGVIALANGHRYIGVELNPEYAAMARDRIARFQEEASA